MDRSLSKTKLKREIRRRRHQWAWVTLEGKVIVHNCRVLDVSQNGAKVVIDLAAEIGTRLELALVPRRPRQCEIVWRRGRTLGIKFVP
jgi:PilZ domain